MLALENCRIRKAPDNKWIGKIRDVGKKVYCVEAYESKEPQNQTVKLNDLMLTSSFS